MNIAAILLVIAALGGLGMVILRVRGRLVPPATLAAAHGLLVLTGLSLVLREWVAVGLTPLATAALATFGLAALGGATLLLGFHVRGRPLPLGIMIVHGLVGLAGVVLLLLSLAQVRGAYVPPIPPPASGDAVPGKATPHPGTTSVPVDG